MTFPRPSSSLGIGKVTSRGVWKPASWKATWKGTVVLLHLYFHIPHCLCNPGQCPVPQAWEGSNFHHLPYPVDNSRDTSTHSCCGKIHMWGKSQPKKRTTQNRTAGRATRLTLTSASLAQIAAAFSPHRAAEPSKALHIRSQFHFWPKRLQLKKSL